jgi:RNA-directed DNA polymerase
MEDAAATWWIDSASSSGGLTLRAPLRSVHVRSPGRSHCDLETFFDTVNHQKMMSRLRESVADERLLDLIGKFLKAGVILPDGAYEKSRSGVPQGGPLSPLLANILLDELDKELEERGHAFVRYADDFVILCHGRKAADRVLASVTRWISRRLRLTVNEAKSKVVPLAEAHFLGFRILRKKVRWTDRSREKLKGRVRAITKRTRGVSPRQVMVDLQRYLRGAVNYYAPGIPYRDIVELDRWLRRRVRLYHWKQWGRPRTRRRKLLALGIGRDEVHMASRSRKGHWRMSRNSIVHRAMTYAWLHSQGVPDLVKQWEVIRYPDGPKGPAGAA